MRALLLLLPFALAACNECSELAELAATVELGTGETSFGSVTDGDTLTAEWGTQGGMHVWTAVRTTGLATSPPPGPGGLGDAHPEVEVALTRPEGSVASFGPSRFQLRSANGGGEAVGLTVQFFVSAWDQPWLFPDDFDPDNAQGDDWDDAWAHAGEDLATQESTLTARVTDRCGVEVEDTRSILVAGFTGF